MPEIIPFVDAMRSQPKSLEVAYWSVREALEAAELATWQPGQTIGVVAMGASSHSGNAVVAALAEVGVRAVNIVASELEFAHTGYQPADHYLIVSESGRSPEPLAAAGSLTAGRRIGITNDPDAQIATVVDVTLGLGGFRDSPVYTAGYTATLLAYALLLDRVGARSARPELAEVPEAVRDALERYDPVASDIGRIAAEASAIDTVGRGGSFASAAEAALLFREGLRVASAGFETYQYLHGPIESVANESLVILFGDGRELTVPDSVLTTGAHVVLITAAPEQLIPSAGHAHLTIVRLDQALDAFVRPIIEIVIVQLIVAHASEHKPFPIEEFALEQHDTKLSAEPMEGS